MTLDQIQRRSFSLGRSICSLGLEQFLRALLLSHSSSERDRLRRTSACQSIRQVEGTDEQREQVRQSFAHRLARHAGQQGGQADQVGAL